MKVLVTGGAGCIDSIKGYKIIKENRYSNA